MSSAVKKALPKTVKLEQYKIDAITKAAVSVSRKNMSVICSKDTQAFNTGQSIHLPWAYILGSEEEVLKWMEKHEIYFTYEDMYGLALHEGMHTFLKSFDGKDFGKKACPENPNFGHTMFNLAEDSRIDYVGKELHPGWAYDLKNLTKRLLVFFFKDIDTKLDFSKSSEDVFNALIRIVMSISAEMESLIDEYIPECRKDKRVSEIIAQSKEIFEALWKEPTILQTYITTKKLVEMFQCFLKHEKNFSIPTPSMPMPMPPSDEKTDSDESDDSSESGKKSSKKSDKKESSEKDESPKSDEKDEKKDDSEKDAKSVGEKGEEENKESNKKDESSSSDDKKEESNEKSDNDTEKDDLSDFNVDEPKVTNPTLEDRKKEEMDAKDNKELKNVERIIDASEEMTSDEIEKKYKEIKEYMRDDIHAKIQNEKRRALRPIEKPEDLTDPADYTSVKVKTVDEFNRAKEIYCDIRKGLSALKKENGISNPEQIMQQILEKNNPLITNLQANFEKISATVEWKSGKRKGRLDSRKITRLVTDPKDDKLFQKKEIHEGADVILLVDESGSMSGSKIESAREAAVVISKALENTRINFSILGFGAGSSTRIIEKQYKVFGEKLDLRRVAAIGVSSNYCQNRDGTSIRHCARHFDDTSPINKKILIVISDGEPSAYGYSGIYAQKDTAEAINELRKRGIFVFAISIDQSNYADTYLMPAYGLGNYFKCSESDIKNQLKRFGIRIAQAIF